VDPALTAVALLALTHGLGWSALGGKRDGPATLQILAQTRTSPQDKRAPRTYSGM
jgi:hypothetical protein